MTAIGASFLSCIALEFGLAYSALTLLTEAGLRRQLLGRRLAQQPFLDAAEWTSVFGSEPLTGALLDRLTHHVHILEINGDSFRLAQSKRRSCRAKTEAPSNEATQE